MIQQTRMHEMEVAHIKNVRKYTQTYLKVSEMEHMSQNKCTL